MADLLKPLATLLQPLARMGTRGTGTRPRGGLSHRPSPLATQGKRFGTSPLVWARHRGTPVRTTFSEASPESQTYLPPPEPQTAPPPVSPGGTRSRGAPKRKSPPPDRRPWTPPRRPGPRSPRLSAPPEVFLGRHDPQQPTTDPVPQLAPEPSEILSTEPPPRSAPPQRRERSRRKTTGTLGESRRTPFTTSRMARVSTTGEPQTFLSPPRQTPEHTPPPQRERSRSTPPRRVPPPPPKRETPSKRTSQWVRTDPRGVLARESRSTPNRRSLTARTGSTVREESVQTVLGEQRHSVPHTREEEGTKTAPPRREPTKAVEEKRAPTPSERKSSSASPKDTPRTRSTPEQTPEPRDETPERSTSKGTYGSTSLAGPKRTEPPEETEPTPKPTGPRGNRRTARIQRAMELAKSVRSSRRRKPMERGELADFDVDDCDTDELSLLADEDLEQLLKDNKGRNPDAKFVEGYDVGDRPKKVRPARRVHALNLRGRQPFGKIRSRLSTRRLRQRTDDRFDLRGRALKTLGMRGTERSSLQWTGPRAGTPIRATDTTPHTHLTGTTQPPVESPDPLTPNRKPPVEPRGRLSLGSHRVPTPEDSTPTPQIGTHRETVQGQTGTSTREPETAKPPTGKGSKSPPRDTAGPRDETDAPPPERERSTTDPAPKGDPVPSSVKPPTAKSIPTGHRLTAHGPEWTPDTLGRPITVTGDADTTLLGPPREDPPKKTTPPVTGDPEPREGEVQSGDKARTRGEEEDTEETKTKSKSKTKTKSKSRGKGKRSGDEDDDEDSRTFVSGYATGRPQRPRTVRRRAQPLARTRQPRSVLRKPGTWTNKALDKPRGWLTRAVGDHFRPKPRSQEMTSLGTPEDTASPGPRQGTSVRGRARSGAFSEGSRTTGSPPTRDPRSPVQDESETRKSTAKQGSDTGTADPPREGESPPTRPRSGAITRRSGWVRGALGVGLKSRSMLAQHRTDPEGTGWTSATPQTERSGLTMGSRGGTPAKVTGQVQTSWVGARPSGSDGTGTSSQPSPSPSASPPVKDRKGRQFSGGYTPMGPRKTWQAPRRRHGLSPARGATPRRPGLFARAARVSRNPFGTVRNAVVGAGQPHQVHLGGEATYLQPGPRDAPTKRPPVGIKRKPPVQEQKRVWEAPSALVEKLEKQREKLVARIRGEEPTKPPKPPKESRRRKSALDKRSREEMLMLLEDVVHGTPEGAELLERVAAELAELRRLEGLRTT